MRGARRVAIALVAFAALAVPTMVAAADEQPADQATTTQPVPVPPASSGAPDTASPPAEPVESAASAAKARQKGAGVQAGVATSKKADAPTAAAAATRNVVIQEPTASEFRFFPKTLEIKKGETVRWTNETQAPHTVTANNGTFDSGEFGNGETYDRKFDKAGTFAYYCRLHEQMTGRIVVGSTSGGDALTSGSGGTSGSGSSDTPLSTFSGDVGSETSSGGSSGSLPSTGSHSMILALLGADLLLAGLVLRGSLRRRRV